MQLELTPKETQRLEVLESIIEAGVQTFVHVGNALLEIKDSRLYRQTHRRFEDYCNERWGMDKSYAHRLISAAEVVISLSPVGDKLMTTLVTERQIRPLTTLDPDQQRTVWQRAVETAPNGKITAAHVQAVVDKYREEERTSADKYSDEEDYQQPNYVYRGGLARCKYCWEIHDKWEPSADTPTSIRWVCGYCDQATADAYMDCLLPEPDDNATATHPPDVDITTAHVQSIDDEYRKPKPNSVEDVNAAPTIVIQWSEDELYRQKLVGSGLTVYANMKTDLALIRWAKENNLFERVDRTTDWGNPFVLPDDGDRETVVKNYSIYLNMKPSLFSKIHTLKGKVLGCWCYPELCHAKVLQERTADGAY